MNRFLEKKGGLIRSKIFIEFFIKKLFFLFEKFKLFEENKLIMSMSFRDFLIAVIAKNSNLRQWIGGFTILQNQKFSH